jgi:hypothetical protein
MLVGRNRYAHAARRCMSPIKLFFRPRYLHKPPSADNLRRAPAKQKGGRNVPLALPLILAFLAARPARAGFPPYRLGSNRSLAGSSSTGMGYFPWKQAEQKPRRSSGTTFSRDSMGR